jgi:hypothetical protein
LLLLCQFFSGLFFASYKLADSNTSPTKASFLGYTGTRYERNPARFDEFVRVVTPAAPYTDLGSLISKCNSYSTFLSALLGGLGDLRFVDAATNSNFRLYTPSTYASGSTLSHFEEDATKVNADCLAVGIALADCSQLMTPQRPAVESWRFIGENTKRVMRAYLSSVRNPGGKCTVDPFDQW